MFGVRSTPNIITIHNYPILLKLIGTLQSPPEEEADAAEDKDRGEGDR